MRHVAILASAFLAPASLLVACGGPADPCATPKTFTQMKSTTIKSSCVFSSCHDAASKKGALDLQTDPYAALVNVTPDNAAARAEGFKRAIPNNEEKSFVVLKLTLPTATDPRYGDLMPNKQRDDAIANEFRCWVRRGAPND